MSKNFFNEPIRRSPDQYHSIGQFRARNRLKGKGMHPRDSGEKLTLDQVDTLVGDNKRNQARQMVLANQPHTKFKNLNSITNTFYDLHRRIDKLFKTDPDLINSTVLKKEDVYDFLNTLDWRLIEKPYAPRGKYITALTSPGTFDPANFDQSKFVIVLQFLTNKLGANQVLDEDCGIFSRADGKKAVIAAGSMAFEFTTVGGKKLLDTIDDPEEVERIKEFGEKTNTVVAFRNKKMNTHLLVSQNGPLNGDVFLNEHGASIKARIDNPDKDYQFIGTDTDVICYEPESADTILKEPVNILEEFDQSVSGKVTNRFADLMDLDALSVDQTDGTIKVVVDVSKLGDFSPYLVGDDFARRIAFGENITHDFINAEAYQ